jgi:hypothetical protein
MISKYVLRIPQLSGSLKDTFLTTPSSPTMISDRPAQKCPPLPLRTFPGEIQHIFLDFCIDDPFAVRVKSVGWCCPWVLTTAPVPPWLSCANEAQDGDRAYVVRYLDVPPWSVDLEVKPSFRVEDDIINIPRPQIAIFQRVASRVWFRPLRLSREAPAGVSRRGWRCRCRLW